MRRYLIPLLLCLLAFPVVFSSHVDEALAQSYRTDNVTWVGLHEANRTGPSQFTTPEDAYTAAKLAVGTPLRILRAGDGDTDFTGGFAVSAYTANTPAGFATIDLYGPDITDGAIEVQWLNHAFDVVEGNTISVCNIGCDYIAMTPALAAATAGDVIQVVGGGSYSENLTCVDGVYIEAFGATFGTGAGPAVTCATDHSMTIHGATLSATAAYSVAIGEVLTLDDCEIVGTRSGIADVDDVFWLPSGEAIATYIPADSSVIGPIVEGDRLYDENNNIELSSTARDGTMRWRGQYITGSVPDETNKTVSYDTEIGVPIPAWATGFLFIGMGAKYECNGHSAAAYFTEEFAYNNVVLGSYTTQTLTGTPANYVVQKNFTSYSDVIPDGTSVSSTTQPEWRHTETGVTTDMDIWGPWFIIAPVIE